MSDSIAPNFIIVGAPKCGTTAMMHYLNSRPDVFFCDPKEPYFFCTDFPGLRAIANMTDWSSYQRLFTGGVGAAAVGEGSTMYLCSDVAIAAIRESLPDARIIVMTRDPVSIAVSFHRHLVKIGLEDVLDFGQAWALSDERRAGRSIPAGHIAPECLDYRRVASIGSQVKRVRKLVPASQRLIIPHASLSRDPQGTYGRVLEFLELPPDGRTSFPRFNEAGASRSRVLGSLARSRIGRLGIKTTKQLVPGSSRQVLASLKERLLFTRSPKTLVDEEALGSVSAELAPESELLDRLVIEESGVERLAMSRTSP